MPETSLVPFRPAAPHPAHRRYRVVGVAAGLGLLGGAALTLAGVIVGLAVAAGDAPTGGRGVCAGVAGPPAQRVVAIPAVAGPVSATAARWADHVVSMSAQGAGPATGALGAPGDGAAWSSGLDDVDQTTLEVGFSSPVRARSIVVAEAGAVGAVTQILARARPGASAEHVIHAPVSVGGGHTGSLRRFDLHGCVDIATLSLTVEEWAVPGRTAIDAVGVLPCAPGE